jgi:hypothetical protein
MIESGYDYEKDMKLDLTDQDFYKEIFKSIIKNTCFEDIEFNVQDDMRRQLYKAIRANFEAEFNKISQPNFIDQLMNLDDMVNNEFKLQEMKLIDYPNGLSDEAIEAIEAKFKA